MGVDSNWDGGLSCESQSPGSAASCVEFEMTTGLMVIEGRVLALDAQEERERRN